MLQKQEWSKGAEYGEIVRPLDEIEAFRNSLAVVKKPAGVRRRSLSISRTHEGRWKSDRSKIDLSPPKKAKNPPSSSSSSIWNWKPLRAISQIRHRKFDCRFTLQIHSIEGIPPVLDHSRLCVHWRRDGEEIGLSTRSALVSYGAAVFEEILEDRCTVYGSRSSGHRQTAKYKAKPYMLLAAVAGAPGLDLGEHRVDLTRLLPLTLEELEDSSGRWSTAFKLSGQARGALLNVSFGFSLLRGDLSDLGRNDRKISLRRAGSLPIPNHDSRGRLFLPSQSVDEIKVVREILPASIAAPKYPDHVDEFSGDGISDDCSKINFIALRHLNKSPPVLRTDVTLQVTKIDLDEELTDPEFTVIEKGIEFVAKDTIENGDDLGNHEAERQKHLPEEIAGNDEHDEIEKFLNFEFEKSPPDCHSGSTIEPDYEELNSLLQNLLIFEPADWEPLKSDSKSPEQHNPEEIGSMILDDEAEFLRLLGLEHADSSTLSNDGDQESPKARLWMQFQEESLADREKNIFDLGMGNHREMNWMDFDCEFDLSAMVNAPAKDALLSQSINSRRRAKQLDNEEAEALMRELGLNEGIFLHTPPGSPTGFGSPIELLPDDHPHVDEDDDDDDDDDDRHHRFKNSGSMIMQASNPLVMPAVSGAMDILQSLGSLGIEKLAIHAKKMMPFEDFARDRYHGETCSSELVSLKDLPRMAMEEIKALSIEGLKIQAGTSELKVFDAEIAGDDSDGELISLAISPEEWMKLDSGMIDVHDLISDRTGKILPAHHGNVEELAARERRDFLGNKVTLAFMVQLRNDEPVGGPMLALVQAERPPNEINSFDEGGSLFASGFKITDVHLAGVKRKTPGMRSLEERSRILASSSLEIDGVVEVCGDGDYLWSISKPGHVTGAFVRNPNISLSR